MSIINTIFSAFSNSGTVAVDMFELSSTLTTALELFGSVTGLPPVVVAEAETILEHIAVAAKAFQAARTSGNAATLKAAIAQGTTFLASDHAATVVVGSSMKA